MTRELFEAGFHLILLVRKAAKDQAQEMVFDTVTSLETTKSVFDMWPYRIEIIEGDITERHLGLNELDYLRLSNRVDEVFHCAAATKFNDGSDTKLVRTNVHGTEHVLWFCLSNKTKRLHHISTAYVAGTRQNTVFEHELEKGQSFHNNYEKSKFDAEKLLGQFTRKHNIPVTVYRPSIIVGDSETGFTNNYDNIYVFGKGLTYLKTYEMRSNSKGTRFIQTDGIKHLSPLRIPGDIHGTINLVPVDYVARAITAISQQAKSKSKTFHIVNPSPPTLGELAEWMETATGVHRIKIVPMYEFQKHPHALQEKLFLRGTEAFQPYMFGEPHFDSTNTKNLLSGTAIQCPLITQELMNRFIQYGTKTDWGRENQSTKQSRSFMHYDR